MKKRNLFLITLLFLFSLLYSQERGFKIIAKSSEGQIISLYKGSYALVIGVSDYESGWPDLPNAASDANAVGDLLASLGFEVTRLINPTESQLTEALKSFVFGPGQDSNNCLVIFFAGHGHTEKMAYGADMGYIVPKDAPLPFRDKAGFMQKAINMQTIEGYARSIQAKHALFLFDSCFSGAIFDMVRAVPAAIGYKTANPVRQFITAGGADEPVPDRSIFRGQLIEGLKGESDLNKDGYITGTELGEFLQEKVVNYSRNSQHPQYGKIRDPNLDKGDFVFVLENAKLVEAAETQLPPKPPETSGLDLASMKKAEEERAKIEGQWQAWQEKMKSDFDELERLERGTGLEPEQKKALWQKYLETYNADNPFSSEDEQMRQRAAQLIKELSKVEAKVQERVSLRSNANSMDANEVKAMLTTRGFFDRDWNESGGFSNSFESRVINGDKVLLDDATSLMWHQSGSENELSYNEAKKWVDELNSRGYAGYHDWRLPTLEEGASLLESTKMNHDLYIDPRFSANQRWIWTSDMVAGILGRVWVIFFYGGYVHWDNVDYIYYVRPVRSGQELTKVEIPAGASVSLRSSAQSLNKGEVGAMLKKYNFFSLQYDWNKEFCNPSGDFSNSYESKVINGDKVVLDHATGLMWHQSGSENMKYDGAKKWIDDLNRRGYAGYHDWRLPTLEEGASLLERKKMNGNLYIDPKFSANQQWIWTSDMIAGESGGVWVVGFGGGAVGWGSGNYYSCVRPVRSGQ